MQLSASDAGAGVVRSFPSRLGSLFDGSRPLQSLQLYMKHRPAFMAGADAVAGGFCYFSPLNVIAKIGLGKFVADEVAGHCVITNGEGARFVMPGDNPQAYFGAVLEAMETKGELRLIPKAIADHLGNVSRYKPKPYNKEHLSQTERVQTFPGGRLKTFRNELKRADARCDFELFDTAQVDEYLGVNKAWYAEAKSRHFRPYDKTSIDWLIQNWDVVQEIAPDCRLAGVREKETGKLIAFSMVCDLTDQSWHCFTRRYVRDTTVPSPNMLCWWKLAQGMDKPLSNDGTADSAEIRRAKERYTDAILTSYSVGA